MDETLEKILDCMGTRHGSGKELADYLGISPNVITNWKNESNRSYRKYLKQIAKYFNVTVGYLLGNEKKSDVQKDLDLTKNELLLIKLYRDMTDAGKKALLDTADALHSNFKKDDIVFSAEEVG